MTTTPPPLETIVGRWMRIDDLAHLPSMRSPSGQGHVNADLTSLSWLALPPTTVGYHTGVLRRDGVVLAAERCRWMPYGVQRASQDDRVSVESNVRFATGRPAVLWRTTVTNVSVEPVTTVIEQELAAMLADSDVDWGWLYGTPWNHGHHHDFFATEKIRATVLDDAPSQTHLLPNGSRRLRLGKPRIAGIQRDEDDVAMLLDSALPAHYTEDRIEPDLPGADVVVHRISTRDASGTEAILLQDQVSVPTDTDQVVGIISLEKGAALTIEFEMPRPGVSGVIATHGNHPDSLQIGVIDGRPWMSIGGEIVEYAEPLEPGHHVVEAVLSDDSTTFKVDDEPRLATTPWWVSERWTAAISDGVLAIADSITGAWAHYAFASAPDELRLEGSRGIAAWNLSLAPGESRSLKIVLDLSSADAARAAALAADFGGAFDGVRQWWESTWDAAFTPGNTEFSGYLPLLHADIDLQRTYYTGILEAIYMRNTQASPIGSIYLSGGPRLGPTTTFFWDIVEWARIHALLDPSALRAWIVATLSTPYDRSLATDCKNLLPIGNYYSVNDFALFRSVESYVGVTGDVGILSEPAGDRTVLEHIREMAFRPEVKRAAFGGGVLVDFGDDPWELLEAVPNYRYAVVSFNAGYVGMLRGFADLMTALENPAESEQARALADELARAVVGQYAGAGRWNISTPGGDETIGHCLDFQYVAGEMPDDLSDEMKSEMSTFVKEHLIEGDWMRALAQDDPIAPFSDRPDHGASGAFTTWPADTAYGLSRIGDKAFVADWLGRMHRTADGAVWGQAMEYDDDGRIFVSERGCHCRDVACGAGMSESILKSLFGFSAGFAALMQPGGWLESEFGRLVNLRAIGFDLTSEGAAVRAGA